MSELLASIRADLTDRRLLPVVALVGALLVAAIAYAVLGGSGSTPTPRAQTAVGATNAGGGISVSSTTPEQAVAETTDGFKEQKAGKARNPFSPLPGSASTATATVSSSTPHVVLVELEPAVEQLRLVVDAEQRHVDAEQRLDLPQP